MYTERINIIMKGEILSRIQSYQTIRGKSSSNLHNKQSSHTKTVINPIKIQKYIENQDDSVHDNQTELNQVYRINSSAKKNTKGKLQPYAIECKSLKRIFNSGSQFHRSKKNISKHTIENLKKSIDFEQGNISNNSEHHNLVLSKNRGGDNHRLQRPKKIDNGLQNIPHKHNTEGKQQSKKQQIKNSEQKCQIKSSKDLREYSMHSKKDIMKLFTMKSNNRTSSEYNNLEKERHVHRSQKCIKLDKLSPSRDRIELTKTIDEQKINRYNIESETGLQNKKINKLTKTATVLRQQNKYLPYFDLTSKKKGTIKKESIIESKSQTCKNIKPNPGSEYQPTNYLLQTNNRVSQYIRSYQKLKPILHNQEQTDNQCQIIAEDNQEVSIELNDSKVEDKMNSIDHSISVDVGDGDREGQLKQSIQSEMILGDIKISRIQQNSLNNDSQFLEQSQKKMISRIEQKTQKGQYRHKKKYWGHLPTDFMKG